MSFFDVPIPPQPPQPPEPEQPEWAGPPRGVIPATSEERAVLFKTDRVFLMVHRFLVYPNGLELTFHLRVRDERDRARDPRWEPGGLPGMPLPDPLPDDFLRLGLQLSDGTTWTNLDWRRHHPLQHPGQVVVLHRRSGGGRDSYNITYWLWPLPPEGPLTLVAEWPAYDVAETQVAVDATSLRALAAEAEIIWPE